MAEYTYEDIIMDPNDPRLEGAIGKVCYFNDSPKMILEHANNNSPNNFFSLKEINKNNEYPFTDGKYEDVWTLIIIKKEEPKPKYVPFETGNEFLAAYCNNETEKLYTIYRDLASHGIWLKNRESDDLFMVVEIWDDGVVIGSNQFTTSWNDLSNDYTFLNGTPCRKEVEDE